MFDESTYRTFFRHATGRDAHEYQVKVGQQLMEGRSVVLRAPTGAGKTWSVLVPFFSADWQRRPTRLIYALPLRTLAQGIFWEAQEMARRLGLPIEAKLNQRGREQVLAMTEGNITQAAKLAGKYRADFYDLLKKHDLKVEDFKRSKTALPN